MKIVYEFIRLHQAGLVEWEVVELTYEAYFVTLGGRRTLIPRRSMHLPFDIERLSDDEVTRNFRFHREHLPLLKDCFQIHDEVHIPERRYRVPGMTALCILLKRMAYPNRLCVLEPIFGMSSAALSSLAQYMLTYILQRKEHLLTQLDSHTWLNPQKLEYYAEAIAGNGAPMLNCWGFIDETCRHTCRPTMNQENYYSGHKRYHCLACLTSQPRAFCRSLEPG